MLLKQKGIQFALVTAVVSGVSIFINKFAVGSIKPPLVFTATKNFGVGLMILLTLIFSGKISKLKKLTKKDALYLLGISIIGGSIPFYLFFTGLSQAPAINGAIIHKTLVLWVAILAYPFLKEKITRTQAVAVVLLFTGNVMIGGFEGFAFSKGELFILLATILWAVENILAKKALKNVDPDIVTVSRMFLGSLILVGSGLVTSPSSFVTVFSFSVTQWVWMSLTMVSLLAYVMTWYRALKFAPVVTVATILASSTLITNILSAIFITHKWNLNIFPQAGLVILGVALVAASYREAAPKTLEVQ